MDDRTAALDLVAPFRKRSRDPDPADSRRLNRLPWRIETVAGQFVDRYRLKRVRARDPWHLTARVARKVLSHPRHPPQPRPRPPARPRRLSR